MRLILALSTLLATSACSSWAPNPEDITPVPDDRLLAYQQPREGAGEIVVTRDFGIRGGGCYIAVRIDRELAARIHVGERARFKVPSGRHVVGIGTDPLDDTLCSKGRLRREQLAEVAPGQRLHYRITSENDIGFDIRPDAP